MDSKSLQRQILKGTTGRGRTNESTRSYRRCDGGGSDKSRKG